MQSETQSGDICAEYQPLSFASCVCAVSDPESQTTDKQSGRIDLGLRRAEPETRRGAGTNSGGICRKPISCPANEKICHQRARDRRANRRQKIDRVSEPDERRKNLRPDIA